jgi:hypothetical protein
MLDAAPVAAGKEDWGDGDVHADGALKLIQGILHQPAALEVALLGCRPPLAPVTGLLKLPAGPSRQQSIGGKVGELNDVNMRIARCQR